MIRLVKIVDKVYDWKTFFEKTGKRITGIGGPTAPRVFRFEQFRRHSAAVNDNSRWLEMWIHLMGVIIIN
jgi:hypothetical protein